MACAWYPEVRLTVTHSFSMKLAQTLEVNWGPLSLTMSSWIPKYWNMWSNNNSSIWNAVGMSWSGRWMNLENRSMITRITVCPWQVNTCLWEGCMFVGTNVWSAGLPSGMLHGREFAIYWSISQESALKKQDGGKIYLAWCGFRHLVVCRYFRDTPGRSGICTWNLLLRDG